jgi:hypothetical protein
MSQPKSAPNQNCMVDGEQDERIFIKDVLTHSKGEPGNGSGGNLVEVHDFSLHPERVSREKDPQYEERSPRC